MLDRDRLGEFNFGLIFRFSRIRSTLETLDSNDISGKCSTSTNCRMDRRVFAAVVAEWLRRLTRNQIPSGSVGSSPTDCVEDRSQIFFLLALLTIISSFSFLHLPKIVITSKSSNQNSSSPVTLSFQNSLLEEELPSH